MEVSLGFFENNHFNHTKTIFKVRFKRASIPMYTNLCITGGNNQKLRRIKWDPQSTVVNRIQSEIWIESGCKENIQKFAKIYNFLKNF